MCCEATDALLEYVRRHLSLQGLRGLNAPRRLKLRLPVLKEWLERQGHNELAQSIPDWDPVRKPTGRWKGWEIIHLKPIMDEKLVERQAKRTLMSGETHVANDMIVGQMAEKQETALAGLAALANMGSCEGSGVGEPAGGKENLLLLAPPAKAPAASEDGAADDAAPPEVSEDDDDAPPESAQAGGGAAAPAAVAAPPPSAVGQPAATATAGGATAPGASTATAANPASAAAPAAPIVTGGAAAARTGTGTGTGTGAATGAANAAADTHMREAVSDHIWYNEERQYTYNELPPPPLGRSSMQTMPMPAGGETAASKVHRAIAHAEQIGQLLGQLEPVVGLKSTLAEYDQQSAAIVSCKAALDKLRTELHRAPLSACRTVISVGAGGQKRKAGDGGDAKPSKAAAKKPPPPAPRAMQGVPVWPPPTKQLPPPPPPPAPAGTASAAALPCGVLSLALPHIDLALPHGLHHRAAPRPVQLTGGLGGASSQAPSCRAPSSQAASSQESSVEMLAAAAIEQGDFPLSQVSDEGLPSQEVEDEEMAAAHAGRSPGSDAIPLSSQTSIPSPLLAPGGGDAALSRSQDDDDNPSQVSVSGFLGSQ